MGNWMSAYWLAQVFLTRLPAPRIDNIDNQLQARAVYCYPLVGLVIGLALAAMALFLPPGQITNALILCAWVFITGGLHIDGLGDSADGWLGGLGSKERTLEIMKDPRAGSAAVMTISLLLLLKFSALNQMPAAWLPWALLSSTVIGRCVPALLFFTTPYARQDGLASAMLTVASAKNQLLWVGVLLALIGLMWSQILGLYLVLWFAILALVLFGLRALMCARIGGVTGDTVGASVEITEMVCLIILVYLI